MSMIDGASGLGGFTTIGGSGGDDGVNRVQGLLDTIQRAAQGSPSRAVREVFQQLNEFKDKMNLGMSLNQVTRCRQRLESIVNALRSGMSMGDVSQQLEDLLRQIGSAGASSVGGMGGGALI